jgi:hypothetical protein
MIVDGWRPRPPSPDLDTIRAVNKSLRYLGAGSAYLAPPLLLVSDILLIQFISEPGLFVQRIALIVSGAMIGTTVSRRIAALIGGDVMFLAAFWSLAKQMMRAEARVAVQPSASRG